MITSLAKATLRRLGLQIKRYPDKDLKNRQIPFKNLGINKVLDVGANTGQFASELRIHGFEGNIISFEPLSNAFERLKKESERDKHWIIKNMALGDFDGETVINVSGNSQSSSILEMLPAHLKGAPQSEYIGQEKIKIQKLDTVFYDYCSAQDNILLKIDTQGYEKNVIDGALKILPLIKGIKLEMSLEPLYKGELVFWDMVKFIEDEGYTMYSLENTYSDPGTGKLLQVDGIFYRQN